MMYLLRKDYLGWGRCGMGEEGTHSLEEQHDMGFTVLVRGECRE